MHSQNRLLGLGLGLGLELGLGLALTLTLTLTRYTELKTSIDKRAFPYPLSMPDDWLREVLEFFPAPESGKGEGAPSPHNKFLINFGGHYVPGGDIVALAQAMDGAVGCAIDSDDPMTYASRGVTKHVGFVTLENVGSLLKKC